MRELWFLMVLLGGTIAAFVSEAVSAEVPHFACGVKVVEASQTSATVWVRLTQAAEARFSELAIFTRGLDPQQRAAYEMPLDVVPGVTGFVQARYWVDGNMASAKSTGWSAVSAANDYVHQFRLRDLVPGTRYRYEVSAKRKLETGQRHSIQGAFATAPKSQDRRPVCFVVSTCQAIRSIDSGKDGHRAYQQMLNIAPDFFIHTGDFLYYDKVPVAKNVQAANAKWNLMFAYGHSRQFLANVSSYFMKDDHDTLKNDCWPGQIYGALTFNQGQEIFRRQVGIAGKTYRTVRWGQDVQIWMTENRDFRSPNRIPDGPGKTILGEPQKEWLKRTVADSDATFKFIVSPGPIVGPDKKGKNDNHSNPGFTHEGQQLRDFIAMQENAYVICGDRHWQYCSQDPQTGVTEFGCGPINDQHNFGGNPGQDDQYHRYFSPRGGFLVVRVDGLRATAEWIHANDPEWMPGQSPRAVHTEELPASTGQ